MEKKWSQNIFFSFTGNLHLLPLPFCYMLYMFPYYIIINFIINFLPILHNLTLLYYINTKFSHYIILVSGGFTKQLFICSCHFSNGCLLYFLFKIHLFTTYYSWFLLVTVIMFYKATTKSELAVPNHCF